MTEEEIFLTVLQGFKKGLHSFVLQSGEDNYYTTDRLCRIVSEIKEQTDGQVALTLSCGIRSFTEYRRFKECGADRYLLRFETADPALHRHLRDGQTLQARLQALHDLRSAGLEIGSGFMVGLPGETDELRIRNLALCRELQLDMIGIGPFLPHPATPLRESPILAFETTIRLTAILRLILPDSNIPATTASGTLDPSGREKLLEAGANVLMPNITPVPLKKHYLLYPGKICLDESGFECISCLKHRVGTAGKTLSYEVGTSLSYLKQQSVSCQKHGLKENT
jgi:biotin synthase